MQAIKSMYKAALKGPSQVVWIWGEKLRSSACNRLTRRYFFTKYHPTWEDFSSLHSPVHPRKWFIYRNCQERKRDFRWRNWTTNLRRVEFMKATIMGMELFSLPISIGRPRRPWSPGKCSQLRSRDEIYLAIIAAAADFLRARRGKGAMLKGR